MKQKPRSKTAVRSLAAGVALALGGEALAQSASGSPDSTLADLDLAELMNVPITTVSRKAESAWKSAAAIHVITQEDIQRSGATSVPEALRMAPGLQVARIDSRTWAVSSRGFNDFFANKLLVLMDGRSVYTPLFSGVFWDVQDTLLEDIDRIEVIRGPGSSLWGANAVNGIINIITKSAKDTQGTLLMAGGGTEERGFAGVRYGGKVSEDAFFRVYAKYNNGDDSRALDGTEGVDEWQMWRGGFRFDLTPWENNHFTFQGDAYTGTFDHVQRLVPAAAPTGEGDVFGGNLLGNWRHEFSQDSDFVFSLYYDRTERDDTTHRETRDTGDVDFQHRVKIGERNDFMWGVGYRLTHDELGVGRAGGTPILFIPDRQDDQLFSTFVQDDITIVEDRLRLTLGSKFEHNDYTHFEWQPSGRIAWTPAEEHTVWAAVSRAVRTPARFEHTVHLNLDNVNRVVGNPGFDSEKVTAYELGYRIQPIKQVSFDLATFYNDYEDLRSIDLKSASFAPPSIVVWPNNRMEGESYGFELSGNWNVVEYWRLTAGYTFLKANLHEESGDILPDTTAEGDSPKNQVHLRSYLDLPFNLQFDTALYYVDVLRSTPLPVSSYWKLDARVGWRPLENRDLEFSIVGQNLLDKRHQEFRPGFLITPHEIERSVYAKVTYRF